MVELCKSNGDGSSKLAKPLFKSFWQAGFESACHINKKGVRLDMAALTQHDRCLHSDYCALQHFGIRTVREGIPWNLVDNDGSFDFSPLACRIEAAQKAGIEVIWSLLHFGWPDNLDLLSPEFIHRFIQYSRATARFVRQSSDQIPFYAPINEVSFLAWAAGEKGMIYPFCFNCGGQVKRQLVKAVIASIKAIWEVDPRARIVHPDPLVHIVAPVLRPELQEEAARESRAQTEAWDMIGGYRCPELGGDPSYLDILGVNYYHSNQWELRGDRLRWEDNPRDARWKPLSSLLSAVYQRYRRPLLITETSHFGSGRASWIREIGLEVKAALQMGLPIEGVCIYPILDRPDWENLDHWHHSGLWNLKFNAQGQLERVLEEEYAAELVRLQSLDFGLNAKPGEVNRILTPPASLNSEVL